MSAPRVLLVAAANATTGGGEKHVADLLRGLIERGFTCSLAAPPGGDLGEIARSLGVMSYSVALASGLSATRVAELRRAIASAAPDIVHAHGSRAAFFTRLADPIASTRVVYTVHGIHVDRSGSPVRRVALRVAERFLRPRTARFITVCKADLERGATLGIVDRAKAHVVYNGIELPQQPGDADAFRSELRLGAERPLAVCVARFEKEKDHEMLVDAFALVHEMRPDAVLALIGAGALEGRIRERVMSLRLGEAVRILRPRPSVANAYAAATAVVLSSRWEGLPYTVVEAMAYAKPVIATRVDGIPEAVEDGITGLLVEPGDARMLAEALGAVFGEPDRARRMGEAGASRVPERFTLERMLDGVEAVYGEVIRGR